MSPSTARSNAPGPMAARWRIAAVGAALTGYALLSHLLMLHAAQEPWAVAVLFGPLVLAVAAAAAQRRQWRLLAACAAGVALLGWVVLHGGVADMQRLYVMQHGGLHLALAWTFGVTLREGDTPLITAMAQTLHRQFTPELRAYTRWLTGLWVVYFLGMVGVSVGVYVLAPWAWWSFFGNLLTPLAAVGLFVGEYIVRYHRHPEFERVSLRGVLEAYRRQEGQP